VADAALRVLAPLGLVFDENSPWLGVSACVGSPGCARSRADVRAEAARSVAGRTGGPADAAGPVHYAGCERACGRPAAGTVLVATGGGYLPIGPATGGDHQPLGQPAPHQPPARRN
jgi:precorrin-3B synthase